MGARAIVGRGCWADLRAGFRWRVPDRFSIPAAICDDWAARAPRRAAILHDTGAGVEVWTYGALKDVSDRLAAALARAGVGRGDRVAILLPQCPEVMVAHVAAMKLGAISLPLFTLFGEDALRFRLEDAGVRAAVTDRAHRAQLEAAMAGLAVFEAEALGDLPAATLAPVGTQADDPAMIIYTSGTTGTPKGALHAHRFLLGHLPAVELNLEFMPEPDDVGWTPADWAWIGGLMDLAMPCLYHGVPLVARRLRKFDPDEAFALIARHRARVMFVPPTALRMMRGARVPEGVAVRAIGSGGEALGDLHGWAAEALRAPVNELYGQTECNLVVSMNHHAMEIVPGSMGRAVPGHEVAILEGDSPARDGETGEICVRMPDPVAFLGYWGRPGATAEKVRDGWLRTGDLGRRDAEGNFFYESRDDDVITSAGYRIGPTEIETCLTGDPDVTMAAVVGLPDALRTEIVAAFVVLRPGASREGLEERLVARVRARVSPHVAPRRVEVVAALPMTATGKIRRKALREAWSG